MVTTLQPKGASANKGCKTKLYHSGIIVHGPLFYLDIYFYRLFISVAGLSIWRSIPWKNVWFCQCLKNTRSGIFLGVLATFAPVPEASSAFPCIHP
jgi:hypothetical protein